MAKKSGVANTCLGHNVANGDLLQRFFFKQFQQCAAQGFPGTHSAWIQVFLIVFLHEAYYSIKGCVLFSQLLNVSQ